MAKEPTVFGFRKDKANTLSRIADRAGLGGGLGSRAKYPQIGGHDRVWIGKADSNIASGASGTVSIWIGDPGSEQDSGEDLEGCFNRTGIQCDANSWVEVREINGNLYVFPLECPA